MRRTRDRSTLIPPAVLLTGAALGLACGCSDPAPLTGLPDAAGAVAPSPARPTAPTAAKATPSAAAATASSARERSAGTDAASQDGGAPRRMMIQDLPVPDKPLPIP